MLSKFIKSIIIAIAICISILFAVGVFAVGIFAQTGDDKRFEVSGAYSHTFRKRADIFDYDNIPNGWLVGTAYKLNKWASVYAEVGQDTRKFTVVSGPTTFHSQHRRTTVLGGARFHLLNKTRVTPFAQIGVGYGRFVAKCQPCTGQVVETNFALGAGGGVDVALNQKRTFAWRTSGEYRRVEDGLPGFRLTTGIVFKF